MTGGEMINYLYSPDFEDRADTVLPQKDAPTEGLTEPEGFLFKIKIGWTQPTL